ncbi:MAG: hypothetical protein ACLGH0_07265, partial [Thermoanaerobaculia bacterium]
LWAGRWATEGGRMPVVLTVISVALAIGTKPTAGVIAFGVAVPPAVRVFRSRVSWRGLAATALASLLAFALLGGAAYIANIRDTGSPFGGSMQAGDEKSNAASTGYGDYANLLRVPYLILAVPFSRDANSVWVPWRGERWFWPRYELFSSHFGAHVTLLVLALPFALRSRDGRRPERLLGALAALVATLLFLPLQMRPLGFFNAFPRYLLFLVPVIAALVLPPARPALRRLASVALIALFCAHAIEYALRDRFAPFAYAREAARAGGTRQIYFLPQRIANGLDKIARPNDTIAFLGGFDSWSYPLYGAGLSRRVIFLPLSATAATIPDEARWVAIDRGWRIIWGAPGFEHMGEFNEKTRRGKPGPDDLRLIESLSRDCRFALVHRDPSLNQAVFVRVPPGAKWPGRPAGCP